MKVCPKCKESYKDDVNFCLSDGATLVKKKNGAKPKEHSRVNEVFAVLIVALAVLVFLCLATYSPTDWSLNTASSRPTQNWIGVTGAVISDLLFQAMGLSAYIFPAILGMIAWRVFHSIGLLPHWSRVVGFLLLIVSVSGFVALAGWQGGVIGAFAHQFTAGFLGMIGSGIVLVAFFLTSLLLITDMSFFGYLGEHDFAWHNLRMRVNEYFAKRRGERELNDAKAKERFQKRLDIREGRTGELLPTIIAPETKLAGKRADDTLVSADSPLTNAAAAVPTITAPEPTVIESQPKITSDDSWAELDSINGPIPITPVKHTDELGEIPADEESPDQIAAVPETRSEPQSFDDYTLPSSEFLTAASERVEQKEGELLAIAKELEEKTKEFNVTGRVMQICQGPVVTTYEFKPDAGVKYSRVTGLVDDLCLALKAESIRIDRIPGKAFVGIEVPNHKRETIQLREVIESKKFKESDSKLTIALGKTIDGLNYVTDLAKMPHLLIAGATGAGKSVGVNTLVVSILYKARPDEVKFIMVDPKRLELGVYADIPHLATPIITDPKRAAISLRWAVTEMERRYKELAGWGVRNISGFNDEVKRRNEEGHLNDEGEPWKTLPYIVIIIDELADLMMVSGKEVEEAITRLAQMARAVGIHLVLATQRPSVDVITGLIKANFPSRISFRVSSKVDSRTIIDANGAEGLLGRGDMLFLPPGNAQVVRVHGAYVDEKEIFKIVEHIKAQGNPEYDTTITKTEEEMDDSGDLPGKRDPLFWDAVKSVVHAKRASTSLLQRHLRIGYGRAAAILDAMVREGYIGEMDGSTRARPVLQKAYDDLQDMEEMESV